MSIVQTDIVCDVLVVIYLEILFDYSNQCAEMTIWTEIFCTLSFIQIQFSLMVCTCALNRPGRPPMIASQQNSLMHRGTQLYLFVPYYKIVTNKLFNFYFDLNVFDTVMIWHSILVKLVYFRRVEQVTKY